MTQHQISLVQSSWQQLKQVDPVLIGDVFYTRLFLDFPQVQHLFHTSKKEQSKKLVSTLVTIVNKLDHLEELTADIEKLAIRHTQYGVQPKHYEAVGQALLWTIRTALGNEWNEELNDAWAACYQLLSQTMIKATVTQSQKTISK